MVVPPRRGGDCFPAVETPPPLLVPEGEQEVASFEGGGHRGGHALLEV